MNILFCGHQLWACLGLEEIVRQGHEIKLVITETEEYEEKNKEYYEERRTYGLWGSVDETARRIKLPVFRGDINTLAEVLPTLNIDLGISISYHTIVKDRILDMFKIVNLHNSLLPKYRGLRPIHKAIEAREKEIGVTAHYMDRGIDTGEIIMQKSVPLLQSDGVYGAMARCLPLYPLLVKEVLDKFRRESD